MSAALLKKWEVTPAFLLLAGVTLLLDTQNLLPAVALAAAVHELGHLAALRAAGGALRRFRLTAAGAVIETDLFRLSYPREIGVCLAGPAASLLFALAASRCGAEVTAGVSLALGLFNLWPAPALDGGRILRSLLLWRLGRETRTVQIIGILTAAGCIAVGLLLTIKGGFCLPLMFFSAWMLAGEGDVG